MVILTLIVIAYKNLVILKFVKCKISESALINYINNKYELGV